MPTIQENYECWNNSYDWRGLGNEWSEPWGGPERQWVSTIFPRISAFLPAGTILEIGPGRGRWSQYLRHFCHRMLLIDISPGCIAACRERFGTTGQFEYLVNDGLTFPGVPSQSVDFIFSFDSLVHADESTIRAYLLEAAAKLAPKGCGFIHHSNLGHYRFELPRDRSGNEYWRCRTMSARLFQEYCHGAGLECIRQETVQWLDAGRLLDCFSLFCRRECAPATPLICNSNFMAEAKLARNLEILNGQKIGSTL